MSTTLAGPFLDTAVKLASLGASGVCIFSVLCTLWVLVKGGGREEGERRLISRYMTMCVIMTVIIASSSIVSAWMNSTHDVLGQLEQLRAELDAEKEKSRLEGNWHSTYMTWHNDVIQKNDKFRSEIAELKVPAWLGGGKMINAPGSGPLLKALLEQTYIAPVKDPSNTFDLARSH